MPRYVDIAAVHIQRYLARTPTLAGRRGASAALVAATNEIRDTPGLVKPAHVNTKAGQIDGVLSLVLDDTSTGDAVLDRVLAKLRTELPGAEFQAAWGDGDSYLDAYVHGIKPMIERGETRVDLPAGAEFPLARMCGVCHTDPAIKSIDLGDGDIRDACADCLMRYSSATHSQGRTAEMRLAACVGAEGHRPRGFEELAELGDRASGRTHIATVHADGNRVGEFFTEVSRHPGNIERDEIVKELAERTFKALAAATCAVRRTDDAQLCVVPHLIGGDDVLVSLPADRAWRFTAEFLRDFGARAQRLVREHALGPVTVPTMSAGLVFSRKNFSFPLMVEEAERCLRQAKSAGAGKRSYIHAVDVTVDGMDTSGQTVAPEALKKHRTHLDRLARMPHNHRHRLSEELSTGGLAAAQTLAARLGRTDVLTPFTGPRDTEGTGTPLEQLEQEAMFIDAAQALRIGRWWR